MSKREAVLGKVRRALAPAEDDSRRSAVADRLAAHPANLIPARGRLPHREQVELFCRQAEKVQATVARLAEPADVPGEIADYLRMHNLPASIRMGADPRLSAMPWDRAPHIERLTGPSDGRDLVGVSHAVAGVAETGTLVLASGPDNPTTLNFLPDTHIVVVDAADVVGDLESVWTRIRASYGEGQMPRTVNAITGPSRSGDIEQTIILGAHGPRAVHIVVVG